MFRLASYSGYNPFYTVKTYIVYVLNKFHLNNYLHI